MDTTAPTQSYFTSVSPELDRIAFYKKTISIRGRELQKVAESSGSFHLQIWTEDDLDVRTRAKTRFILAIVGRATLNIATWDRKFSYDAHPSSHAVIYLSHRWVVPRALHAARDDADGTKIPDPAVEYTDISNGIPMSLSDPDWARTFSEIRLYPSVKRSTYAPLLPRSTKIPVSSSIWGAGDLQ